MQETKNNPAEPDSEFSAEPEPRPKRNSGRTGPKNCQNSRFNALRHGACANTLILPAESDDEFLALLNRWLADYQPEEDSLSYEFVLKVARAEWNRIRCEREYNSYRYELGDRSSYNWGPDEIKRHDLALRYYTAAQRAFQREYRLLQDHYKTRPMRAKKADPQPEPEPETTITICRAYFPDPSSPTGYTLVKESPETELPVPRPYTPPPDESEDDVAHPCPVSSLYYGKND